MRLPDAPLLEVVFELRWKVTINDPKSRPLFGYDPGYEQFDAAFSAAMAKAGYKRQEVIVPPGPTVAHFIAKRFRTDENTAFPLVQIGHGLFAVNLSTDYEWANFKKLALDRLRDVIDAYPKTKISRIEPVRIELRYIDIFNTDLLKHGSLSKFLMDNTNVGYNGFPFIESNEFEGEDYGRLRMRRGLANKELGWFQFDAANAQSANARGILTTSRVVKEIEGPTDWTKDPTASAEKWLDAAHGITSKFFESFVSPELMTSFKTKKA